MKIASKKNIFIAGFLSRITQGTFFHLDFCNKSFHFMCLCSNFILLGVISEVKQTWTKIIGHTLIIQEKSHKGVRVGIYKTEIVNVYFKTILSPL